MSAEDQLLTVRDVARRASLSEAAVRRAVAAGELAATKLRGRLRIPEAAYERWVEEGQVDPNRDVVPLQPTAAARLPRAAPSGSFRARLKVVE